MTSVSSCSQDGVAEQPGFEAVVRFGRKWKLFWKQKKARDDTGLWFMI
jgi:hypothetical protein